MPTIITRGAGSAVGFGLFGTVAAATDPYFNYNTLLLPGNGTNGGQNNTFLDSSTNNYTITRNGNTTQGTFSPFSQTGWSNYFNGSSTVSAAYNSAFQPNTYVSLECWVYFNSLASDQLIIGREGMWLNYSYTAIGATASKISFGIYNTSATWVAANSTTTPALNQWYHIVGVRDNTTLRIYINGVQEGTATFSGTPNTHTSAFAIGGSFTNTSNITGYVSNARYCNGATSNTLPYTGTSFTVPTSPLTVSTNTILLTCQSNRFVDNSGNAYAITANGSPSVQPFSPFNPTTAYSTSSIGGSGYFDGSGDSLSTTQSAYALGTSNFTIEFWFYKPTTVTTNQTTVQYGNYYGVYLAYNGNLLYATTSSGVWNLFNGTNMSLQNNAWNHIAFCRNGTTISLFTNGTRIATTTSSSAIYQQDNSIGIGNDNSIGTVSGFRVVIGSYVYDATQSSITVPTSPPTAIANTQLLLNFTNAGIIDNTAKNVLETVGNAQISTTQSKFGGGSFSTGATSGSNCLTAAASPLFQMMTGNFTVEGWFLPDSGTTGTERTFYIQGVNTTGGLALFVGTGGARFRANGTTDLVYSGTISTSVFTHIAFVRNGNTRLIFVNGTQVASDTLSFNNNDLTTVDIGAPAKNASDVFRYYGYIDDLRITKGIARYTSNFTPPTAAFPLQ